MKIIFVGIPDLALVCLSSLLEKKFNIVGVVPPLKTHETYPYFKNFVLSKGLNLIDFDKSPNEKECIEKIKSLNADIGVVCAYDKKFSKEFLSTTKLGYLNCHPSKLPYYRGAMPYFHIIKDGVKQSGITIHFMDENFDTGDIVAQKVFDVMPEETMGTLFNRTNFMLADTLIEILSQAKFKRTPQIKGIFPTAPKVEGNFKINWNLDIFELDNLIRACNPFYNVFCEFRGITMKIILAHPIKIKHNLNFGTIAKADENNFFVAAKNGYLALDVVQLNTWGIFKTKEFYNTFNHNLEELMN